MVDMGKVKANYTLISSSWHDHGHIGAAPNSIIFSEPGTYKIDDNIVISGIETKENRGTRNVIFNIVWREYSITNFADLGDAKYLTKLSKADKQLLAKTNIAFARPNMVTGTTFSSINLALKACVPKVLIPHHYYPTKFVDRLHGQLKTNARKAYVELKKTIDSLHYPQISVTGHKKAINLNNFESPSLLLFEDIHHQVKQTRHN
jgi:hypothetical protein